MAGPETALALGQPDLSTDNLGGQPAMAPMTTQAAPAADQLVQGQQQASRPSTRMNVGLQAPQPNPNRAYSAAELSNEKPWESRASGGDFIAAPRAGQIPWGIIADRAAQVQKQKAELAEGMKKMFGGDKFEGQAAPQYEREYQRWAIEEEERFKKEWADIRHGGNMQAATKDLFLNPESNAMYMARMRDIKAAGIANKHYVKQAQDYLDGVRSGVIHPDPEMMRTATEMVSGGLRFSGPGTPSAAQMADRGKQWDKVSSRSQLFNDQVRPRIKEAQDELVRQGKITRDKSGRLVMDKETFKGYNRLIEATAKEWENQYGIGTEQENKQWLTNNLGQFYEQDTEVLTPSSSGGSSQQPQRPIISNFQITEDAMVPKAGGHTGSVMSFKLQDKDRKPLTETFQFVTPNGAQRSMVPDRLAVDKNGKIYIIGKDPTVTDVSVEDAAKARSLEERIKDIGADIDREKKANADKGDRGLSQTELNEMLAPLNKTRDDMIAQKAGIEKTTTKRNAEFPVPMDLNESTVRSTFGDEYVDQVKKNAEAYRARFATTPSTTAKPAAKTTADPLGIL